MNRTLRRLLLAVTLLALLFALVLLAAAIAQLGDLAARLHPGFGVVVWCVLGGGFALLLATPVWLFFRLPPPLVPPEHADGPEHAAYLQALRARLRSNPILEGRPLDSDAELEDALALLAREADRVTREAARIVFIATAVMQNGRLDGLMVFAAQCRLVWQIATLYLQRPTPRQMLYLYSNVAVTALAASAIDEIDFSQIVTPIVLAAAPSAGGAVPGLQGLSALLVNCLAHGSANAVLTLRVGAVARRYCGATVRPDRADVRRSASLEALQHVGRIVRENGSQVARSVWKSVTGVAGGGFDSAVEGTRRLGSSIAGRFRRSPREAPGQEPDPAEVAAKGPSAGVDRP
ncbi:DUF697 domain-containing protein [Rivibacter subsaxonicus]|uniref:Uncharacterized protein DUF697 n=1 Tax=Rivibacter subsaxonicus TaxID=457575 RepID=A0A4Q7VWE8_9BURK|nr:DUF697 domain-containing protein [Rivibacter subsaxonicus]RZU01054.1 uncharacterized protein DUF697 [Rivibacter subsaxonicus]